MRHSTIAAMLLASAVTLAGCSPPRPDPRGVGPGEVLLQTSATGQADSTPDQARFQIGVSSIGADAKAASAANATKMAQVVGALKQYGIKDADIQTKQLTVQRQDWGPNKGKFEVDNSVEVTMRDIPKAGAAIAAASAAGANVMWGPNLTVSDPEAAGRSAYAEAYKAARARADAYAAAAGMKVARVLRISDVGGEAPGPEPMMYDANMVAEAARVVAPSPPVSAGTNTQQVSVRVDFALGPK